MAVASIFAPSQLHYSVSVLAGLALALANFGASAAFAALMTPRRSPALGVFVVLAGFVLRLTLVAFALVALVRYIHLAPVPLALGLTIGFTALAAAALTSQWLRTRPRTSKLA